MDADSSPERLGLTADDPLTGLTDWLRVARVDAAAAERTRRRWLTQQAAADASMAGVLLDLAERGRPIVVRTQAGRSGRGPVVALGADFVALRAAGAGELIVPLRAVASVRSAPGGPAVTGARSATIDVTFASVLAELGAECPTVLVSAGGDELRGELRSAGIDVVAIGVGAAPREPVHVATAAIDHLMVLAD